MITPDEEAAIASRLMEAYDRAVSLEPITHAMPQFDVASAYRVLARIEARRIQEGWQPVGRKVGFTNRTIWPRYGVYQPMWAHVWAHTVHHAGNGVAKLSLAGLVQPRIEPEVVFGLSSALPAHADPAQALACVEWMASGFEIVQSHFPDWKFAAADCTAAFGLHGALVVGRRVAVNDQNRAELEVLLPGFTLTLRRGGEIVERGIGANVLGGPAHALAHLAHVLATQPAAPGLARGELVTTGTITDAWPVHPGESWTSDYGELPLDGLTLHFT